MSTDSTDPGSADFSDPKEQGGVTDETAEFGDRARNEETIEVSENHGTAKPAPAPASGDAGRGNGDTVSTGDVADRGNEPDGVRSVDTGVPESSSDHFADASDVDRLLGERRDQNEGQRSPNP
jgi:hypothetical protein